jgi:hypothetical protein
MREPKDHLDIDLEFLDKKESVGAKPTRPRSDNSGVSAEPAPASSGTKYSGKTILIAGSIVLFISWVLFAGDSGNPSSTRNTYTPPASSQTSSSDGSVVIGGYTCSRRHYNRAVALEPSESEADLSVELTVLEDSAAVLTRLSNEIESSSVNEYSPHWEIDQYNRAVDDYNSRLEAYRRDAASLDSRIDRYDMQVASHNDYLRNNCTPTR